MKIQSTQEIDQGPIRLVVTGRNGIGKTSLAKTLPEKDVVILSMENGLRSLYGTNIAFIDLTKDDNGNPWPRDTSATQKFMAFITALKSPEVAQYKHVMCDSLTQVGLMLRDYIKESFAKECEKNKFFLWDKVAEITASIVNYVNDNMKSDAIFLMQESLDKDEENRMFYGPDYVGSAGLKVIMSLFDEIWRMDLDDKGNRILLTQAGQRHKAKTRSPLLPVEEAHLGNIFSKIRPNKQSVEGETNVK